ncbi:sulfurtransferase complex subunit TusC [Vibrio palustris]|uniref:Protein TusC homolog n=1 Tax=Vibrio palustris TaxID=1918946 RepID=A0A1R4B8F8_9VIBR|nr:sulfurtransferase complex subunit TusC [Vibrio palustris]SJL85203.1 Intracellular sulfur oxidation protein DsrF [Vibrio palustris]
MNRIAFVFHTPPHHTSAGREGLDAILAASAYSDDIGVFFIGEGVLQLMKHQAPEKILSRNYISAFKLLELYDIEQCYVCEDSLREWGMSGDDLIMDCQVLSRQALSESMNQFDSLLNF